MRPMFVAVIIGVSHLGCRAQKNLQFEDIDVNRIIEVKGVTFWFDVYDPVSYAVNFKDDSLRIVFYTHRLKDGELIMEEYISTDNASLELFKELSLDYYKVCEDQSGEYECSGLDGSETWVQFENKGEVIIRKYWSPEDQLDTELGNHLNKLQKRLSDNLNIDHLKKIFLTNLAKGRYWNFGTSQLSK